LGIKDKRAVLKLAKYSRAVTIPAKLKTGDFATLAADRLILLDPRGEITKEDLLEFLEKYVEPNFWPWIKKKDGSNRE